MNWVRTQFARYKIKVERMRTHSRTQPRNKKARISAGLYFSWFINELLVGVRGFEPPTPASRRQCSTRLSYTPFNKFG